MKILQVTFSNKIPLKFVVTDVDPLVCTGTIIDFAHSVGQIPEYNIVLNSLQISGTRIPWVVLECPDGLVIEFYSLT